MLRFGTVLGVESCLLQTRRGDTIILPVFLRVRKAEAVEAMFEVCRNLPSGPVLMWPASFSSLQTHTGKQSCR